MRDSRLAPRWRPIALLSGCLFMSSLTSGQEYCRVGSEVWIAGCEASCVESWEGGDCPRACSATPPPGYVIVNHRVHVNSNNNGGHDVTRIAAGQTFDYQRRVQRAYDYALDLAGKAGDKSVQAKIRQDMSLAASEAESFGSSHQMVRLQVSASKHGSFFDRKRGWIDARVELLTKCIAPENLERQLSDRYSLSQVSARPSVFSLGGFAAPSTELVIEGPRRVVASRSTSTGQDQKPVFWLSCRPELIVTARGNGKIEIDHVDVTWSTGGSESRKDLEGVPSSISGQQVMKAWVRDAGGLGIPSWKFRADRVYHYRSDGDPQLRTARYSYTCE